MEEQQKTPDPILVVSNLTKTFHSKRLFRKKESFTAVDNISFKLYPGEILGFLGSNGAGKTTTIQMLLGLMTPTSGTIEYFGKDFFKNSREILKKVTFASSYVQLPSRLTVYENLEIFGILYGLSYQKRKERINKILKAFDLWDIKDKQTGLLSAGQMTCVMLAKAFLPEPTVVLLDEPTAALDPEIAQEVRKFILSEQNEYGVSILFTSHNMDEVTEICDRILVLDEGKIIENSSPEELTKSVSKTRVRMLFKDENMFEIEKYLKTLDLVYQIQGKSIEIDIEEQKIPTFLNGIAKSGFEYLNISIDKPTLEDYFLNMVKKTKTVEL